MTELTLYGRPGWGSMIVEAQLAWYAMPYRLVEVGDLFAEEEARAALAPLNPLAQIPTLVTGDGLVMTESAAITLWLADEAGADSLVPAAGSPDRPAFLRWLVFLVANVYPIYTYSDDPKRFVEDPAAAQAFAKTVLAYGERLYKILDETAKGPWFLGSRFSAIDIYLCAMTHWTPGPAWFNEHTQRLATISSAVRHRDQLKAVWDRNCPPTT